MLSQIPSGTRIFIDSNIFIYHFLGLNPACTEFLLRVESKALNGYTSVIATAEVWHRLMIAEAIEVCRISPRRAVTYLKTHPEKARLLTRCRQAVLAIPRMNISILSFSESALLLAQDIQGQYGLLTNDALNLALMQAHRLKNLVSNDKDFERISEIKTWRP